MAMKTGKIASAIGVLSVAAVLCVSFAGCKKEADGGKLTYWAPISSQASTTAANFGDLPLYKELQERTGIEVEFIHPSNAGVGEQFSIMIASENLPDIIQYNWATYSGGPGKAIAEGIIIDLNKHKNKLPNLTKYLNENDEVRRNATTASGQLFAAPFVRGDKSLCVSLGIAVRKDWLDDLGLEVPETIAEWDNALTQFKNQKGAKAPLQINLGSLRFGLFSGAYDTCFDYYLRDGKVTHGMLDPGFKDLLMQLNDWYKRGLLNPDFASTNSSTLDSYMLNGNIGAMQMALGGGIGKYMAATDDPKFDLTGAKSPVINKGDEPEFGFFQTQVPPTMNSSFTAVSADCKNIDSALKLLDYGYSDEGYMLYNFGIEGVSYEMKDGYPTYTEMITKNPEGQPMNVMLAQYSQSYDGGPFVQDKRYMEQYSSLPQQKNAWDIWTQHNMAEHLLPNLYVAEEDQQELSDIEGPLVSYMNEAITKLIMGTESFDNYDNIIKQLETRGINRAIEIKQKAYDTFLNK